MSSATPWCRRAIRSIGLITLLLPAGSACGPTDDETPSDAGTSAEALVDGGSIASGVPVRPPAAEAPQDDSPAGLLVAAAGAGDVHCVRELLAGGTAPDSESGGRFAIHGAAANGSVAVLHFLVDAGAHLEALDQHGWTALTRAAFYGNAEAVIFLLSEGANPNAHAEPSNYTPLRAILSGWTMTLSRRSLLPRKDEERFAAAWALIQAGADPHFGPGDHPPPAVLAEALGGEIGRLYTAGRSGLGQRPR